MSPANPFFAVLIFLITYLTAHILRVTFKFHFPIGRYDSIDSMRGFLAISVFICHSSLWYHYLSTGKWEPPDSPLFTQLGETSVSLFFMITSFLFTTKLLKASNEGVDWRGFFISRFFRITPMYIFSVACIVLSIMIISSWQLKVSVLTFLLSIIDWSFFTIAKVSLINGSGFTDKVNAGVVWSLRYEWLYYLCLPIISLFILKIKPKMIYLILGFCFLVFFYKHNGILACHVLSFAGGALAAVLRKSDTKSKFVKDIYATPIILICLFLIGQFNSAFNIPCVCLIIVVFTLIALGNSLFGLLRNSTLKFMGEISYSTYLMHGILLFTVFYFGFGLEQGKKLSAINYCLVIFSITPIVVLISFLGFKYIEKPFIDKGKQISNRLKARFDLRNSGSPDIKAI